MIVRAYTLNVNVGHAPCWMYDKVKGFEVLTLANCKPQVRNVAKADEWIAGITPTRMGLRLAYLMQVDRCVPREEYWTEYKRTRLDSIYKPRPGGGWYRFENPWHTDAESYQRDLSSNTVLWSTRFYVFSNSYTLQSKEPQGLKIHPKYFALERGGMRASGHFVKLPDGFLEWIERQTTLDLEKFNVLGDFGFGGCGCCGRKALKVIPVRSGRD